MVIGSGIGKVGCTVNRERCLTTSRSAEYHRVPACGQAEDLHLTAHRAW